MAKRRMIDASILDNEKFASLSMIHRQLLFGMILRADDQGRLPGHPALLRSKIFPYDDIDLAEIEEGIR